MTVEKKSSISRIAMFWKQVICSRHGQMLVDWFASGICKFFAFPSIQSGVSKDYLSQMYKRSLKILK